MTSEPIQVLILGHPSDLHVTHMQLALQQAGARVRYLETHYFPTRLRLSWQAETHQGSIVWEDGCEWMLQDIHRVFWRQIAGVYIPALADQEQQRIAYNDSMSLVRSLIQANPTQWINSWEAYQFHKEKPLQLSTVQRLGVKIPRTLISNDPSRVVAFVQSQPKVIYKPVYGGTHTQLVTAAHLEPQRLQLALSVAPATFQEFIPGTNIRTYVIGDAVFSAEIRSPSLDFREDSSAELIPVDLPAAVYQQCLAIRQALKLQWTAIDWRLTPTQDYVFLEANPSPMFIYFEQKTGYPITEKLVQLLMG
jgi:glutathione synthase/RimK-type ligase-like ATP-grasp enzyme